MPALSSALPTCDGLPGEGTFREPLLSISEASGSLRASDRLRDSVSSRSTGSRTTNRWKLLVVLRYCLTQVLGSHSRLLACEVDKDHSRTA